MSIQVTSTTDTPENVQAANLDTKPGSKSEEKQSAQSEKSESEIQEKSEALKESEAHAKADAEDEDQSDSTDEDSDEEGKKPKKLKGFKKRIDKLSRQVTEKDQMIEYWKNEALRGKQTQETSKEVPAPKKETKVSADDEPREEDFENHKDYLKAVVRWEVRQEDKQKEEKARSEKVTNEYREKVKNLTAKINEFKKTAEDFDDLVQDVNDIQAQPVIQQAIFDSDIGPQIMYELAKNREEYERINSLNPIAAAREIGKLEARLSRSEETPKVEKKTSKAPTPIKPVGSKGSTVKKSIYDPDLSLAEYEKLRREEERARRA